MALEYRVGTIGTMVLHNGDTPLARVSTVGVMVLRSIADAAGSARRRNLGQFNTN